MQSLLVCFLIACEDIVELLNPDEDGDNDHSHLYSERLSSVFNNQTTFLCTCV